jgi:hypothetical protein
MLATFYSTEIPVMSVETDTGGYYTFLCWYSNRDDVGQPDKRKLILIFDDLQKCHQWMALQYTIVAKVIDNK